MKILITGSKGFVGKNLIVELKNQGFTDILEYEIDSNPGLLDVYTKECQFVFHLAGINRPENKDDYMKGNFGSTTYLLEALNNNNNKSPILLSSSIQATLDNPYGKSKKAGEDIVFKYGQEAGVPIYVYRLPNVFGKWCRPNYNSAVATFCNNIANDLSIQVNDPNVQMNLVYIDDVVSSFIEKLSSRKIESSAFNVYEEIHPVYSIKLGDIVSLIYEFNESRSNLLISDMSDGFTKKLYSTYLSYLPKEKFCYPLKMNVDQRGSFTEFLKSKDRGQVSINVFKPHKTKGNHWHHTKNEKFLVVSGKGIIRFRKIDSDEIIERVVSGDELTVVDVPVGYTHNIENIGETDMVMIIWVNEIFDQNRPDTFFNEV